MLTPPQAPPGPPAPPAPPASLPPRKRRVGRRFNRVLAIIFILVGAGVAAVVMYSMYQKAELQRLAKQLTQPAPAAADPSEALRNAQSGYIEAAWERMKKEMLEPHPVQAERPREPKQEPPDDNGLEEARKKAWQVHWENYQQVQKDRFTKRKEALAATNTAVDLQRGKPETHAASTAAPQAAAAGLPQSNGWNGSNGYGASGSSGLGPFGFAGLTTPQIDRQGQEQKREFASQKGDLGHDDVVPTVRKPPDPYAVSAGSFIKFTTENEVNSDIPGSIIGRVSESVYNNDGTCILIPQLSVLLGHYNSIVSTGQSRLPGVLTRINFPDGSHQSIGAMQMADNAGSSGLEDQVNRHLIAKFGGAAIAGLFGAGMYLAVPHNNGFNNGIDAQQIIAASLAQQLGQVGQQIALQNLSIPNTITIRAGVHGTMITDRDIHIEPPWSCGDSRRPSTLPIMSINR